MLSAKTLTDTMLPHYELVVYSTWALRLCWSLLRLLPCAEATRAGCRLLRCNPAL